MSDNIGPNRLWKDVSPEEWEDWQWQLRNRIYTLEQLREVISVSPEEEEACAKTQGRLVMAIPPYWADLMDPEDPACPIRLQTVPLAAEFDIGPNDMRDPCGEDGDMPVPGLVHRYPDRVLFLVTEQCAMYCRHCTRRRLVGVNHGLMSNYEPAFSYLRQHKEIRDVLISGGDPLMMTDVRLDKILGELRKIEHLEFIRIGSRTPITMPQRVTGELCEVLKRHKPIWMSLHVCHPKEVSPRVGQAMDMLAEAGVPLGSQTVLLKGINDDSAVMMKLMHELLKVRVRPYYIYQCDPAEGISHFRTSVEKGVQIIESLRGHTSGYAVPTFVIDGPGGGGKIPLGPNYVVSYKEGVITLRNFKGELYTYHEPVQRQLQTVGAPGGNDSRANGKSSSGKNGSGNGNGNGNGNRIKRLKPTGFFKDLA